MHLWKILRRRWRAWREWSMLSHVEPFRRFLIFLGLDQNEHFNSFLMCYKEDDDA